MLETIGGELRLEALEWDKISEFSNLKSIGSLRIRNNSNIIDLNGFSSVKEIQNFIAISENEKLFSLEGFDNLDIQFLEGNSAGYGLFIIKNPSLESCDQDFVCELLRTSDIKVSLRDNASSCSDFEHLFFTVCRAHVCYADNLKFDNQEDIDSFQIKNPKCTYLEGDLVIGSTNSNVQSDITNLDGLNQIDTIIGSTIIINNENLISVEGISDVDMMTEDLRISNNESLIECDIYNRIGSFLGDIEFSENKNLTTLNGPVEFFNIDGSIVISNNPSFTFYDEFENLKRIGNNFIFNNNSVFTSGHSFNELEVVHGDVIVSNNEQLTRPISVQPRVTGGNWIVENNPSIISFPLLRLDTIIGDFVVKNNAALSEFEIFLDFIGKNVEFQNLPELNEFTFRSIEHIGGDLVLQGLGKFVQFDNSFNRFSEINGDLVIKDNPVLESLDGLKWFNAEKIGFVEISNNPQLSICNIGLVCAKTLFQSDQIIVSDNSGICTNLATLREECDKGICYQKNADFSRQTFIDDFVAISQACHILEGDLDARSSIGSQLDISKIGFLNEVRGDVSLSSHSFGNNLQIGDGLSNLEFIDGDFFFDLDNEIDFKSINKLEKVSGRFLIRSDFVEQFNGLERLEEIGSLELFTSRNIRSFEGLSGLRTINDNLIISFSDSLRTFNGLQNLEYVGNKIQISGSTLLTDIFAIAHVDPRDLEDLSISSPVLTDCNLNLICEFMFLNPGYEFLFGQNNKSNCSDFSEVNCEDFGVTGHTFYDANSNGLRDISEYGIPNINIIMALDDRELFSNERGTYFLYLDNNQPYELSVNHGLEWSLTTPQSLNGTFSIGDTITFDIGLEPNFERHKSLVDISSNNIRCSESGNFFLRLQNTGTYIESGEIHLNYDSNMTYINSDRSPIIHDEQNSILIWDYNDFQPFEAIEIDLEFTMPNQNFAGERLQNVLIQYYDNDDDLSILGEYSLESEVRCAYDPNDKQINPIGEGEINGIYSADPVVYTIRFQNTGNDYARNIRLVDTLSQVFNHSTFELLSSSHHVYTSLEDHTLSFYFDDIYLIDSLTNPHESQGYVSFRIQLNENLPNSTLVENKVDIYFDFNEPITTNTTSNVILDGIKTSTLNQNALTTFEIQPNPTVNQFKVNIQAQELINYQLTLTNVNGQIMLSKNLDKPLTEINVEQLVTGIYFVKIMNQSHELIGLKKLIIAR